MTPPAPRRDAMLVAASVFELAAAAGVAAFWVLFYTSPGPRFADPERTQDYFAFESAFPAADATLALALAAGGIGLLRRARFGPPVSIAAAGGLVFLGILDVAFNAHHGVYPIIPAALLVNLVCIIGGGWLGILVWRHRNHWGVPFEDAKR